MRINERGLVWDGSGRLRQRFRRIRMVLASTRAQGAPFPVRCTQKTPGAGGTPGEVVG